MKDELRDLDVRFIREAAAAKDELKSHERVANAVVAALAFNRDLRVVGIFGAWGSGKSTVVKLVEETMKPHQTRFFTYDAWVHQSDTPRRAFLEELLRFMDRQDYQEPKLSQALDRLLGKSERTETVTAPSVPIWVGFVLAALTLSPFAFQFLRTDWAEWLGFGYYEFAGEKLGALYVWAAAVAALPFALLMSANLWRTGRSLFAKDDPTSGLVALFANKVSEVRTDIKTKDPEPTALEFQRFLRKVLAYYQTHTSDRLVFVVDNLDRLPDAEMLSMWSTIRGLFHGEPANDEPVVQLPTVLLPVDEAAIHRFHKDKSDSAVAEGFVAKTFDVVFRVPTPVLSRWHLYLEARLKEVFRGSYKPEWTVIAARVLEDAGVDNRTPRSINTFVNQVATLWLQWRSEAVSFAAMCFYATYARQIDADAWGQLRPPRPWMSEFDGDWTRGVAAIRYGAKPTVANQILIEPPLRAAIEAMDTAAFQRLSEQEGFAIVLRRLCEQFRQAVPAPLSQTIVLIDMLGDTLDPNLLMGLSALADGVASSSHWKPHADTDVKALRLLLGRCAPAARKRLVAAFPTKISQFDPETFTSSASYIVSALGAVAEAAEQDGLAPPLATLPPGIGPVWAVCDAGGSQTEVLRLLKPQVDDAALVDAVAESLMTGRAGWPRLSNAISTLLNWRPGLPWSTLVKTVEPLLWQDNPEAPERALQALALLWVRNPDVRADIVELTSGENFQNLQVAALGSETAELSRDVAIALTIAAGSHVAGGPPLTVALEEDDSLATRIDARLSELAPTLSVLDLARSAGKQPAAAPLFAALMERRLARDAASLDPSTVARHASMYQALPQDCSDLIWARVRTSPAFWRAVEKGPEKEVRLAVRMVLRLPDTSEEVAERGVSTLKRLLTLLDAETWRKDIAGGGPAWEDLQLLAQWGRPTVGGNLRIGLEGIMRLLVTSGDMDLAERWFSAAGRLPKRSRTSLYAHLARRMLHTDAEEPLALLERGGDALLRSSAFMAKPDEFVRRVLTKAATSPARVAWLAERLGPIRPIVRAATPAAQAILRRRLEQQLASTRLGAGQAEDLRHLIGLLPEAS